MVEETSVIRFEHAWMLWLLLLVPVVVGLLWYALSARRKSASRFISANLLERIAYSVSWGKLRLKAVLWILAFALLILGLSDPQVGTKLEEVKREGIDIIIALDVSNSMLSEDIRPSRLESARHEILKFISGLKGDRVGLVAFAGTALNYCPLTTDYGAAKLLVNVMKPDIVSEQGTALAEAITVATKAFNDPEVKSRVLLIISDGEDHEEQAIEAAKDAGETGIKIYTVGLGSPQGSPIPVKNDKSDASDFKRDRSGQVVMTRLNEVLLQRVADAGGGKYVRGTQSAAELESIWNDISSMEKRELGKKQFTAFEDRFQYLVLPALLFLLVEFLLSERKGFVLMEYLAKNKRVLKLGKEKAS
jgi:Ca-activated chloride channel family protein